MSTAFIILLVTAFFMYNTYYDNYIIKSFSQYKKYYKMSFIFVLGLGFYLMIKKNPLHGVNTVNALNQYVNCMPIDKSAKMLLTPLLGQRQGAQTQPYGSHTQGSPQVQRLNQPSRTHKRSVSETKKKFVASNQQWKCGDCQQQLTAWFEVDHKKRLDQGGSNDINNLIALCRNCHGKKTSLENI
jgi:5-methylcytosine-specific restriction endonuclease McrA